MHHRQSHLAGGTDVCPNKRLANRIMPMHQCESIAAAPFCSIGYNAGCLFANGKGLNGQIGRACLWSCLRPLRPYSQYGKLPNSFFLFSLFWFEPQRFDCCSRRGKVDLHSLRNIQIPFHKSIKPIPSLSLFQFACVCGLEATGNRGTKSKSKWN